MCVTTFITLFSTSCSDSTNLNQENVRVKPVFRNRQKETEATYNLRTQNQGLLADAIKKANSKNNVLMYSINWNSVMYKYGGMAHLIKVLEVNPTKEIYFFCKKDDQDNNPGINSKILKPIMDAKEKFPNFHYQLINDWRDYWSFFEFHNEDIEPILDQITSQNKVVDFYLEDFQVMTFVTKYIDSYIIGTNADLYKANDAILSQIGILAKMRSINMIADGTTAFDNWRTDISKLLFETKNYWDDANKEYCLSSWIRETIKSGDEKALSELKNYKYYGALILESLFTMQFPDKDGILPTKYFTPGCETILDINDNALPSSCLDQKVKNLSYFDPYYTVNADIIDVYASYNVDSKKLFLDSFGIFEQNQNILNNKTSVIYSGRLMHLNNVNTPDDSIITEEAKRVMKLYELEINRGVKPENLQILFKAHPRELDETIKDSVDGLLIKKINDLRSSSSSFNNSIPDATGWLKFLNNKTPMEYYVFAGFLKSDPSKNREVLYYAGFSTTVYMIVGAHLGDSIKQVIVSDAELNLVNKWNGYPSRVFPKNKITTNEELFGS
ncbi:hypothetical protein [Mycoplasmoides alvi]|uniref:hypothetical protein n=1 Tax=Mycoplasmoides alvi TaxID=78580 RepID=UPI0012EC0CD0|nr:hypothetical protein [Mycoplasmoides alvi]